MKNLMLIGWLFFLLVSCEKNTIEKDQIEGIWIESTHKTDTIVFDNQHTLFILNRGTEIRNGYLLPRILSGPYFYEIKGDSISLRWGFSSCSSGGIHYFNLASDKEQIKVGNFFVDTLSNQVIVTFSRIH
jgi:hypothetical protein